MCPCLTKGPTVEGSHSERTDNPEEASESSRATVLIFQEFSEFSCRHPELVIARWCSIEIRCHSFPVSFLGSSQAKTTCTGQHDPATEGLTRWRAPRVASPDRWCKSLFYSKLPVQRKRASEQASERTKERERESNERDR